MAKVAGVLRSAAPPWRWDTVDLRNEAKGVGIIQTTKVVTGHLGLLVEVLYDLH